MKNTFPPIGFFDGNTGDFEKMPKGVYLCYVNHPHSPMLTSRITLMHEGNGQFAHLSSDVCYRDKVYGAYGPLPAMTLDA